jgi:hypothetical protein
LVYTSRMCGNFAIPNPCPKKWQDLEGEGRARFCGTCQTHVHAVAEYSIEEWTKLWQESDGRVCGFLGCETVTTPRSRRAILVGALLTAVAPLWAASGRVRFRVINPSLGTPVQGASISLMDSSDQAVRTRETDEAGELLWADLPLGDAVFLVRPSGGRRNA